MIYSQRVAMVETPYVNPSVSDCSEQFKLVRSVMVDMLGKIIFSNISNFVCYIRSIFIIFNYNSPTGCCINYLKKLSGKL